MARPQRTVLLVEDDIWSSEAIAMLLESEGFCTTRVSSAADAIVEVRQKPYDVVLLDLWLRNANGMDVGNIIDQLPVPIPIILMSATNPMELERAAQRLHAAAVLRKPFDSATLFGTLARVLDDEDELTPPSLSRRAPNADAELR